MERLGKHMTSGFTTRVGIAGSAQLEQQFINTTISSCLISLAGHSSKRFGYDDALLQAPRALLRISSPGAAYCLTCSALNDEII